VIDVTEIGWPAQLADALKPARAKDCTFYCLGPARTVARKKLPRETISPITDLDELLVLLSKEDPSQVSPEEATAARAGDVVVSAKHHPATKGAGAWLSPYHLELVKELLGKGFVVEVLDDSNNVLRTLGGKE